MSIEIGKEYVNKDGKVVEVTEYKPYFFEEMAVIFVDNKGKVHILNDIDFLEQYTYITPIYEYRYCFSNEHSYDISSRYFTDNEVKPAHWINFQRLDFTKQERVVHSL